MLELLQSCWALLVGLLGSGWDIISLVGVWVWDMAYHLHVNAPRLEGLLVGVVLSWLLLRRDKHPLLRVLSAPLKLVVDILDLAWDQVVEVVGDLWGTATDWLKRTWSWVKNKVLVPYNWVVGGLKLVKEKLAAKSDKDD